MLMKRGGAGAAQEVASSPGHPSYRPDIDGLRTIAVLLVIGFHYFPNYVPGGFIGVDMFFVISGYLISTIIIKQMAEGSWSYSSFYTRRINRIFPALAVVLLSTLALGWFVLVADELQSVAKHVAAGSGFLVNFALWSEAGYFDNAAETKPLLHLWSLAIEEQFYIVWPVVLALTVQAASRRAWLALALLAFGSLAYSTYLTHTDPTVAYYSPVSRFYELAMGGAIAYAIQRKAVLTGAAREALAGIGLALIAFGAVFITSRSPFPGLWGLVPTIGTAALILVGDQTLPSRAISIRPMIWIGLISYPLYLWHWPVLVWSKILAMSDNLSSKYRIGLIALSLLLAWATYALCERPIKKRNRGSTAACLAALVFVTGVIGLAFWSGTLRGRHTDPDLQKIVSAVGDWAYPSPGFQVEKRFSDYAFYRIGKGNMTLFVGDSNAEQYAPRIEALVTERHNTGAIFATKGGCPFASPVLAKRKRDCAGKLPDVRRLINSNEVGTVVFAQQWLILEAIVHDRSAAASFESMLASIPNGTRKFVILGVPVGAGFGPADQLKGSRLGDLEYRPAEYRNGTEAKKALEPINRVIREIAARHQATVIDPFEWLCRGAMCRVTDASGRPAYKDRHHLSASFVRRYLGYVDQTLP